MTRREGEARSLRVLHRASALVLAIFLAAHLTNHLAGLAGQGEHMEFMRAIRPAYRNRVIEPLLLSLFGWQIVSGAILGLRGWRQRRGAVAWLQAGSGLYLALFIFLHIAAVLSGRSAPGIDTDFRFAAAGFHVPGWPWYFWPYYSLAIAALFTHLGCAAYWRLAARNLRTAETILRGLIVAGFIVGLCVSASLAGWFYEVEIPAAYARAFVR